MLHFRICLVAVVRLTFSASFHFSEFVSYDARQKMATSIKTEPDVPTQQLVNSSRLHVNLQESDVSAWASPHYVDL